MPLSRNYYAIYQNQGYSAPFICHHRDIISPFQCNYSATNTQFLRHLFRSILFQEDNNIDISVNTQYYNGNVIIIFDNNKLTQEFYSIENIRYDNKIDVNEKEKKGKAAIYVIRKR